MQNIRGNIMHRITHPQGVPLCIFVSKSLKIETRRKLPTRYWLLLKSVFLTLVGQKCYFECKILSFHISNVKWPLMFFLRKECNNSIAVGIKLKLCYILWYIGVYWRCTIIYYNIFSLLVSLFVISTFF